MQCCHLRQEGEFQRAEESIEQRNHRMVGCATSPLVICCYTFKVRFVSTLVYPQPCSVAQGKSHCWWSLV